MGEIKKCPECGYSKFTDGFFIASCSRCDYSWPNAKAVPNGVWWKPKDLQPKDDKPVLILSIGGNMFTGKFANNEWYVCQYGASDLRITAIERWQPLPELPNELKEVE